MEGEAASSDRDGATRAEPLTESLLARELARWRAARSSRLRPTLAVGDGPTALAARRIVCEGATPLPDGSLAPLPAPVPGFDHVAVRRDLGPGNWRLEA